MHVRPPLYVSHCEMPHSTCVATRVFCFFVVVFVVVFVLFFCCYFFGFLAGSCIVNCVLEKKKKKKKGEAKHNFEDDKIQSQFM